MALDEKWSGSEKWTIALGDAIRKNASGTQSAEVRSFEDRIVHFDGFARKDSFSALDYLYWRIAVGLGADADALAQTVEHDGELSSGQNSALLSGAERAAKNLVAVHGSLEASLGDEYRIGRGGQGWPLGGVKFRVGGEEITTLRAMEAGAQDSQGRRWVYSGQRQPALTIFSDPIETFTSAPYGQSDHPDSEHYTDQAHLASDHRLKPTYFNRSELLSHISSTLVLKVPHCSP